VSWAPEIIFMNLMTNRMRPDENSLVDDPEQLHESVLRARDLGARRVFPGHGRPFDMSEVAQTAGGADPTR
jgi:glyoxylase-like metal-dependent hydrolase (beta-lactamase superfamily II)